jgi:succinate dehydrogenase / fumarate reductase iron-sulfur subunit
VRLTLKVWRQRNAADAGRFQTIEAPDVGEDMSFLEMLDVVNERLLESGGDPIAFDHDCREGICGMCSLVIDGRPHGPDRGTTVCQLHLRRFRDGQKITIEPWRAAAFPVIRDLVVDRTAFDRIIQAGGYVSVDTGGCPDANLIPVPKREADVAFDAAACIGCGACVAACPNGAAMLFAGAKVSQLAELPQGQVEAAERVAEMVKAMAENGFGNCSNHYECQAACPKGIDVKFIARLNREFHKALVLNKVGATAKVAVTAG